jgi:hypothetical protein
MPATPRGPWLTTAAILFGILAVSNFLKPLALDSQTGFVFFGKRLSGTPNAVAGPLFGVFLALYAIGIWRLRRYALPMSWVYAAYVLVNLALFSSRTPQPPDAGVGTQIFGIAYAIIAVGVSAGTAVVLSKRRSELV